MRSICVWGVRAQRVRYRLRLHLKRPDVGQRALVQRSRLVQALTADRGIQCSKSQSGMHWSK